jgi:hypothetical protein
VNWEAISAIGQIVGALAVVISLIYLATEIRSNARSARHLSLESINRWVGQVIAHPHLAELWIRGLNDFESLESGDRIRFIFLLHQLFYIFGELYNQQLDGHLDPRMWGPTEAVMREFNAFPGVQAWWSSRSNFFSKEFANYINQLQQTAKPPRYIGKPTEDH